LISFTGSMGVIGSCAARGPEKVKIRATWINFAHGFRIIIYLLFNKQSLSEKYFSGDLNYTEPRLTSD